MLKRNGILDSLEPYYVTCLKRTYEGNLVPVDIPVILPHETINAIYDMSPLLFAHVILGGYGCAGLREFWERSENEPWLPEHKFLSKIQDDPSHAAPLKLWGDKAPVTNSDSIFVVQFSSVLAAWISAAQSRLLTFCVTAGFLVSLSPLWEVIQWSLECAGAGEMPWERHGGGSFLESSIRFRKRGYNIAGNFFFPLAWICGDMEFSVETFHWPWNYFKGDEICEVCHGVRDPLSFLCCYNFSWDSPRAATFRSHILFMHEVGENLVVCSLPGFHKSMVKGDLAHTLHLGLLQYLLGWLFRELLEANEWQGPLTGAWHSRWGRQLRTAYREFQSFCKLHKLEHSQPKFRLTKLGLHSMSDAPYFKAKAANTFTVCKWILAVQVRHTRANPGSRNDAKLATLWGYVHFVDTCLAADIWLTDNDVLELRRGRDIALFAHSQLVEDSARSGTYLFRNVPKHHKFDHIARDAVASKLNPLASWCLADESFIGKTVIMCKTVHGSVRSIRAVENYNLRFHTGMKSQLARNRARQRAGSTVARL